MFWNKRSGLKSLRTSFKPECKLDALSSASLRQPSGTWRLHARSVCEDPGGMRGGILPNSVLTKKGQGLRCVLEVEWRSCLLGGGRLVKRSRKPTACGGEKQGVWGGESKLGKRVWEGLGGCQGLVLPLGGCWRPWSIPWLLEKLSWRQQYQARRKLFLSFPVAGV